MSEETQVDEAGIDRTETGELKDQSKTTETSAETSESSTKKDAQSSKGPEDEEEVEGTEGESEDESEEDEEEEKSLLNAKNEGAPEKYEPWALPKGYELDKTAGQEAEALFKELNLTQAQAQKLIDLQAKHAIASADEALKAYNDMRKGWKDTIRADPDIGGRMPEVRAMVSKAIDAVAGPQLGKEFRKAMDITGAGDHPAFIKTFDKIAQLLTEGQHETGSGPSEEGQRKPGQGQRSAAQAMYPNLPSSNA